MHRGGLGPTLPLNEIAEASRSAWTMTAFRSLHCRPRPATLTTLADVAAAIQTAVQALTKKKTSTKAEAFRGFTAEVETVNGQFRLVLQSGTTLETSSVRVQAGPTNDATSLLKLGPGNGGQSEDGLAVRRPAMRTLVRSATRQVDPPVAEVFPGSDGEEDADRVSFSGAFRRLDNVTDFSLLAVPGEGTVAMAQEGMAYCANRPLQDVFYLAETASHDDTAEEATDFRNKITTANSYGALYFPWVKSLDPDRPVPGADSAAPFWLHRRAVRAH